MEGQREGLEGQQRGADRPSFGMGLTEMEAKGVGCPPASPPKEASPGVEVGTQQDPTGHTYVFLRVRLEQNQADGFRAGWGWGDGSCVSSNFLSNWP